MAMGLSCVLGAEAPEPGWDGPTWRAVKPGQEARLALCQHEAEGQRSRGKGGGWPPSQLIKATHTRSEEQCVFLQTHLPGCAVPAGPHSCETLPPHHL